MTKTLWNVSTHVIWWSLILFLRTVTYRQNQRYDTETEIWHIASTQSMHVSFKYLGSNPGTRYTAEPGSPAKSGLGVNATAYMSYALITLSTDVHVKISKRGCNNCLTWLTTLLSVPFTFVILDLLSQPVDYLIFLTYIFVLQFKFLCLQLIHPLPKFVGFLSVWHDTR